MAECKSEIPVGEDPFTVIGASIALSAPDPLALAEAAVALANTDGGRIALPAAWPPPALAALLEAARARCRPAIPWGAPQPGRGADGPAWMIPVPRGALVHALDDGRVLVWASGGLRELDGAAIRHLISARSTGDFEAAIVPGARPADLDPALLAEFLRARARHTGGDWRAERERVLEALGAVTAEGGVTVAGALLFGPAPERWLPQAGIRVQRVIGGQPALDRTLRGPLLHALEAALALIAAQVRQGEDNAPDYAPEAVREALFNAVVHREYRLRQQLVTVRLSADRLEISSPGGLPGYLTSTQHLLGARYRRNPRLHAALTQWGAQVGAAPGLLGVITGSGLLGSRPPEIESGAYHVTVRLFNARAGHAARSPQPFAPSAAPAEPDPRLTLRQQAILAFARERGSVTLHELRARHGGVHPGLLQADLDALVAAGYLRRIGTRAAPCYILP